MKRNPDVPERISLKFKIQGTSEDVVSFGDSIRLLGQKIYGTATDTNTTVIESFCAGLRDADLASKMLGKTFANLNEAINYATARKETSNIKSVLIQQRDAMANKSCDVSLMAADGKHKIAEMDVDSDVRNTGPVSSAYKQSRTNSNSSRVCFNCYEVGHIQRSCPNQRSRTAQQSIVCYYCKKPGHIRRNCYLLQNSNKRGQGYRPASNTYDTRGYTSGQNFRAEPGFPRTSPAFRGRGNK